MGLDASLETRSAKKVIHLLDIIVETINEDPAKSKLNIG